MQAPSSPAAMHQQQQRVNRIASTQTTGARLRQLLLRGSTGASSGGIASLIEQRTEQGRALHRHIADGAVAACEASFASAQSNGSLGVLWREVDEFGATPLGAAINHSVALRSKNASSSSSLLQANESTNDVVALALLNSPDAELYINLQDK